ncbi:MAG: DUF3644 domain-containing protein [Clostridia bacterium]
MKWYMFLCSKACILNYNEKMMAFHQVDMTKIIPQNFLTLSVSMKALDEAEIVAKYPEEIATKILTVKGLSMSSLFRKTIDFLSK